MVLRPEFIPVHLKGENLARTTELYLAEDQS